MIQKFHNGNGTGIKKVGSWSIVIGNLDMAIISALDSEETHTHEDCKLIVVMVSIQCTTSPFNITWGEKMRPGQEFIWTQLSINNNGSTKNNMIVGVLNSSFNGYSAGIRFNRTGTVFNQTRMWIYTSARFNNNCSVETTV